MMDKEAAIQFIINELERDRTQEEITAALSGQLNAPPDIVSKFVARVVAENQPTPIPSITPSQLTPDVETLTHIEPPEQLGSHTAVSPANQSPATPSRVGEATPTPAPEFTYQTHQPTEYDQEELEEMILKALRGNQRQSDIVMEVCENTGMSWNQAQRLVARTATKHHKHLVSRQNMIIIPLAALAVLAGLALIGASISEGLEMARALTEAPSELPASATTIEFYIREGLWGLVIGMSLLLGGIYGLIRAFQTQFS